MEKRDIAVGLGEVLWDMLPEGKKPGGAPANFAYHAGQHGLDSYVVSAVGNDDNGREILAEFRNKGLGCLVAEVPYPTGTVGITVDSAGIPQYDIRRNVAWDNIPFTPELEQLARRTKAVCFGTLAQRDAVSRDTIRRFLDAMPAESLRVFDINLRQNFYSREMIEDSLRRCNVLKINDDELVLIAGLLELPEADAEEQCRLLLRDYSLKILILTCGVNGSYVFTADETSFLPTPKVEVADTVGAGDSFTGSFIASVLKGMPVAEAHSRAVNVSAYVCTCTGAMPLIPEGLK